jgi:hypothetical protein
VATVIEGPFLGTVVAPNSTVELGLGAASDIRGQIVAKELRVRPQTTLTCLPSSTLGNTFAQPNERRGLECSDEHFRALAYLGEWALLKLFSRTIRGEAVKGER